jgi:hypothetical protein
LDLKTGTKNRTKPLRFLVGSVQFFIQTIKIGFFSIWISLDHRFNWIFWIRLDPCMKEFLLSLHEGVPLVFNYH